MNQADLTVAGIKAAMPNWARWKADLALMKAEEEYRREQVAMAEMEDLENKMEFYLGLGGSR